MESYLNLLENIFVFITGFLLGYVLGYMFRERNYRIDFGAENTVSFATKVFRVLIGIAVFCIWMYSMFIEITQYSGGYSTSPLLYGVFGVVLSSVFNKEATKVLDKFIGKSKGDKKNE